MERQLSLRSIMEQKTKGRLHTGLHTAYLFSIVVSLVISVVGAVLTPWLLKIMNTPQDMMASSTIIFTHLFYGNLIYAGL